LFSISKNHIKKALPKIFTQKPKMNHQIGLAKIKEKPHCKGRSHFGKEKDGKL
jgi:hypothetical protein